MLVKSLPGVRPIHLEYAPGGGNYLQNGNAIFTLWIVGFREMQSIAALDMRFVPSDFT